MDQERLTSLLRRFSEIHILVVGDFFLDLYFDLDRTLSETSLETGLEAFQVVGVRSNPGAAGSVVSNLRALGVQVSALGVIGDDGMGYELLRHLRQQGVHIEPLLQTTDRKTPTYVKPMMHEPDGHIHELNRLDIKNRTPLPAAIEMQVITFLHDLIPQVDGLIVVDQVQECNCGVITDRVRAQLNALGDRYSNKIIAADSRTRIGKFRSIILKPNKYEAVRAVYPDHTGPIERNVIERCGRALYMQAGRPVFLTIGAEGMIVFDAEGTIHVPGIPVREPIDPVGAGDSAMAGIVTALCSGASNAEAAMIGNLVASITVQQIGTTGTATPQQVMDRFVRRMSGSGPV